MIRKTPTSPEPRIYVACLAAYNNAELHGGWIDATQGAEGIRAEIQEVLRTSPEPDAEEYAIHDYVGFGSVSLHEYEDIDHVAELAEFIDDHGPLGAELVSHAGSIDDARRMLEDNYAGCYESLSHFAEDFLEETGQLDAVPEHLRGYIDFASYGRDLDLSGELETVEVDGELHLFWAR